MKTNTPMLCSLLAALATASAQDTPPVAAPSVSATPVAPQMPVPPTPPPVAGIPGAPAPGITYFRGRSGAAPAIEVPALRVEQIAEPVRWNYQMQGDFSEYPLANRKGPVTFLGVNASPPPSELAPHLPIEEDTGLVIEFLSKDSPAAKAGLQERDVLAKLDDQILIHPRQLAVLVANHKEGDQVKITYVRKGQLQETTALLGKQEPKVHMDYYKTYNAAMEGAAADVTIHGQPGSPLKTFVRRIKMASGDGGQTLEITGDPEAVPGGPGTAADVAPGNPDDAKAELQAIRKMLEDLNKRLEEKAN